MAKKEEGLSKNDMAVQAEMERLEKIHGKGVVMDANTVVDVERCSTGSLTLDIATGGGYGLGRIVELLGAESVGKSTLSISAAVEAQKKFPEKWIGIVDVENAYDPQYAKSLGLDWDRVKVSQPESGEQALDITIGLIRTGAFSMVIVDSVAALTPKAELEGEMTDNQIGLQARMMGKALRKITGVTNSTKTMLVFINQTRSNIGGYGSPKTTPGGVALKFFASQRIEMSKSEGEKDSQGLLINNRTKCKVIKNKLAPPFRTAEFNIGYGSGIDKAREILDMGTDLGVIKKGGSWYSYDETKLGQGAQNCADLLRDNPELMDELEGKIKEILSGL